MIAPGANPNNPFNKGGAAAPGFSYNLGGAAAPIGQSDSSKVAASTSVQNKNVPTGTSGPGSPQAAATQQSKDMTKYFPNGFSNNTAAQSTAIKNGANNGTLVSQLGINGNGSPGSITKIGDGNTPVNGSDPVNNSFGTNYNSLYAASAPNILTDPLLNTENQNLTALANEKAGVINQGRTFQTDQYGKAIENPTVADYFGNNTNFNAQKTATLAANLGTSEQAAADIIKARQGELETGRSQAVEQGEVPFKTTEDLTKIVSPTDRAMNIATGGTVGGGGQAGAIITGANAKTLGDLTDSYQKMQANLSGIQNLQQGVGTLLGVGNLNPTNIPVINQAISGILKKGSGDPQYQKLSNYLTEIASKYATYFGQGQDAAVTNQLRDAANGLINGSADPASIAQVLAGLGDQANSVMKGTYDQIQSIQGNLGGVSAPGGSSSGGQYDF